MRASRRPHGFSLAELLMVIAVAAILLAVALPDMRALIRAQQLKAATNDLFGAIELTRAQAIARNSRVQLAPADADGTDWSRGWTVFVDHDGDARPGPGDEIISMHAALPDGIAVAFAFTSPAPPYYIAYNGGGRSCSASSSASARWGTVSLFRGVQTRRIKINMLGRARICDPARDDACEGAEAPS